MTDEGEWTTKCLFIIKSDCKLNIRPTQWPSSETGEGGTRSVTDEGNGHVLYTFYECNTTPFENKKSAAESLRRILIKST